MNNHLRDANFASKENVSKKGTQNKTTVHVKNTYISPYVLYNNKKENNENEFAKLNNILTNEKNKVFIKHKFNYFKDGIHEKKNLRYSLVNKLNLKCFENKGNACELNTITTMIQMNSDFDSDKDGNEMVKHEKSNLVGNIKELTIIRSEDIIRGRGTIRSEEFIGNNDIMNGKDIINIGEVINNERMEEEKTQPDVSFKTYPKGQKSDASFKTYPKDEKRDAYFSYNNYYKDNESVFPSSNCYISRSSGYEDKVNSLKYEGDERINQVELSNSNIEPIDNCCCSHSRLRDNCTNEVIYKCEDSIPLGTILNIHNLDNNNTNILTTVMLRNIPNKYTQKMLMNVMNEHFKGLYDFFYLPIDFRNKCNVGYAFINFIHPYYAELFIRFFNNYKLNAFKSNKICTVTWGRVQGLKANIEHYRNSAIMTIPIPQYKPMLFQNGISVSWPESDGPLPSIKLRSQKY
ncbi:RNA-binding protein mei2 homologue [Plasmodium gonderi]|uniref:RNA-binding protein mei2 homologue n=1 Tax=Plasmodium gonderi TaxID=77519 RepID=A0A1Y1JH01_PLAGO|nr:RNA-binding protein mei2 homologue [Plasmodium gonderi]GAW81796.1 RNA-binding protein mei2 homologue [Plasmodium gonderi]